MAIWGARRMIGPPTSAPEPAFPLPNVHGFNNGKHSFVYPPHTGGIAWRGFKNRDASPVAFAPAILSGALH